MSNRDYASKQLNKIHNRIEHTISQYGRKTGSVSLIGAAKQQTTSLVADFHAAGLKNIGENYLNQAIEKQNTLLQNAIVWHFIGQIQSNKTKLIAEHFSWVHSVDRMKIAQRLNNHASAGKRLQILLQLNLDQEHSKAGVDANQALELVAKISDLQHLDLRGFMLIPKARQGLDQQRKPFALARKLLEKCNQKHGLTMDVLSMGMSGDLEAAIAEGSTMVRIGTDLFGPRPN